jgi:hypothetical protein
MAVKSFMIQAPGDKRPSLLRKGVNYCEKEFKDVGLKENDFCLSKFLQKISSEKFW